MEVNTLSLFRIANKTISYNSVDKCKIISYSHILQCISNSLIINFVHVKCSCDPLEHKMYGRLITIGFHIHAKLQLHKRMEKL